MTTGIVYSKKYLEHFTGISHPESPIRLSKIMEVLEKTELRRKGLCRFFEPRAASIRTISLVHDPDYIELVRRLIAKGASRLDSDTSVSKQSFEVARLAVGGALESCRIILSGDVSNSFALVRPPGHHAGIRGRALGAPTLGFCIFNNVAIAAKWLIETEKLQRILILDYDCHHGNGTQEIFQADPKVLYISVHQGDKMIYPGTGDLNDLGRGGGYGYKINLPLPPGSSDDVYDLIFEEVIKKVAVQFNPQFILISAGFDTHHKDPVTSMRLTTRGCFQLYAKTNNLAKQTCDGSLAAILEGGYGEGLPESVLSAVSALSDHPIENLEEAGRSSKYNWEKTMLLIKNVKNLLSSYWKL